MSDVTIKDVRARLGIWLKELGCDMVHGKGVHCWGAWRKWAQGTEIRACQSCGKYDDVRKVSDV